MGRCIPDPITSSCREARYGRDAFASPPVQECHQPEQGRGRPRADRAAHIKGIALASRSLSSEPREHVWILAVVETEPDFVEVRGQMLHGELMVRADDTPLEHAFEGEARLRRNSLRRTTALIPRGSTRITHARASKKIENHTPAATRSTRVVVFRVLHLHSCHHRSSRHPR